MTLSSNGVSFCLCVMQMRVYVCMCVQEREGEQEVLQGKECVSTGVMRLGERTPTPKITVLTGAHIYPEDTENQQAQQNSSVQTFLTL